MLLREFQRDIEASRVRSMRAELQRLSTRALDKVLAEFRLRGFVGFRVLEVDGEVRVEGLTLAQISEPIPIPDFLREVSHE